MQMVTLTRDMRPWRKGDTPVLLEELVAKLLKSGEAVDPRPYPPQENAAPAKGTELPLKLPPGRYLTRKKDRVSP